MSYRKTFIYPIGLVVRSLKNVELIAIHHASITSIPIIGKEYKESAYGNNYDYLGSGPIVSKYKYELGMKTPYSLLSERDEEILFHYKWNKEFKSVIAKDVLENIISSMEDNMSEPPKGFVMVKEFNDQVINLMITEEVRELDDMSHLAKTKRNHLEIHPDNLEETRLVLQENLRIYKVWKQ